MNIGRTESIFIKRACDIDWVVIFVSSALYSRARNALATLNENPCRGSARAVIAELFGTCLSFTQPSLQTPGEGLLLREE
jgi:hypothetical protein